MRLRIMGLSVEKSSLVNSGRQVYVNINIFMFLTSQGDFRTSVMSIIPTIIFILLRFSPENIKCAVVKFEIRNIWKKI